VLWLAACSGCHPGFIVPGKVDVIVKKPVQQFYRSGMLVIVPFDTSEMTPDLGLEIARIYQAKIIKRNCLKDIVLIEEAPWLRQLTENSYKVQQALAAARRRQAQLLLWGTVEKFLPAIAGRTQVTLNVKLIDCASGTVLWWGRDNAVGEPGNTFLLLGTILSPDPPDAEKLITHTAETMVGDMFPSAETGRGIDFLSGFISEQKTEKKVPADTAAAPAGEVQEAPIEDTSLPEAAPDPVKMEAGDTEKDAIDTALEELEY